MCGVNEPWPERCDGVCGSSDAEDALQRRARRAPILQPAVADGGRYSSGEFDCVRRVLDDAFESVGQVRITTVFGEYLDEAGEERLAGVHGPELTVDVIPPPIETALVGRMLPVAPCPGFGTEPYPPDGSWVDAEDEAYLRHADD